MKTTKDLDDFLEILRKKWVEIPATAQERMKSTSLLDSSDEELHKIWQHHYDDTCVAKGYSIRGWYHDLYADLMKSGPKLLDVGSGMGVSSLHFARLGAHVTCMDICRENLEIIHRVARHMKLKNVEIIHLESTQTLANLPYQHFDVITAIGSLINAPLDLMRLECSYLTRSLKPRGRWLELCYPKIRWEREGAMPFEKWGDKTDGGAPWMEWYDGEKLLDRLAPAQFDLILEYNFHNSDFNWFDLKLK